MSTIMDVEQEKEYQEKLKEFNKHLRNSILSKRRLLLQHLKSTFNIKITQSSLRTLSWTHSKLLAADPDYEQASRILFKGTEPAQCGSNKQEAYHQTHFINACLLSFIRPHTPTFVEDERPVSVTCKFNPNLTISDRLEEMERLYHHLLEQVPQSEALQPKQKITLTQVYNLLQLIDQKLENLHEVYEIQKRTPKS